MESIKIDAFITNLHGYRILCQGPFPKGQVPPLMESIQKLREPFKKKILLSHTAFSLSKYVPVQYDAVFQIKDTTDWTLALTYMTYAPKPLLIISEEVGIPDGLWQKLNRSMTFVNLTSAPVLHVRPYDAIFFAPIQEVAHSFTDYSYKLLQSVYRASYSQKEHKEIVNELRIAGAGIAWSKVEEEQGGNIFWYDPISQNPGDKLTNAQLGDLFSFLSDHFSQN